MRVEDEGRQTLGQELTPAVFPILPLQVADKPGAHPTDLIKLPGEQQSLIFRQVSAYYRNEQLHANFVGAASCVEQVASKVPIRLLPKSFGDVRHNSNGYETELAGKFAVALEILAVENFRNCPRCRERSLKT